jgi:hypothetical protein
MARRVATVALALLVGGCEEATTEPAGDESGIAIAATLEPACPGPATTPPECGPEPFSGELEIADQATGEAVATVTTDSAGRAEVAVPPGSYLIQTPNSGLPSLAPVRIEVSRGAATEAEVAVDSGLR